MVGGRAGETLQCCSWISADLRPCPRNCTPSEVVEILNQYLTLIADCIMRNGGTLDKFIGDCGHGLLGSAACLQEDYVMKACPGGRRYAPGLR